MIPQAVRFSLALAAFALLSLLAGGASAATTNWTVTNGYFTSAVLWDNGVPDAGDTAVIRRGNVSPFAVIFQTLPDQNPIDWTINRLIIGTNPVHFTETDSMLTVAQAGHLVRFGGDMIIGQTATDVAVLTSNLASLSVDDATLGSAAGSSGTLHLTLATATFNVIETDEEYDLSVGSSGMGAINVSGGADVTVAGDTALGVNATGVGSINVSGSGSTWTSAGELWIGWLGGGTLDISAGADVTNGVGAIATYAGTSVATVDGSGSTWTNTDNLFVGNNGDGTLNITNGGQVSNDNGHVGNFIGSTGEVNVFSNSNWTNYFDLYVGYVGNGAVNLSGGGDVLSDTAYIGNVTDSVGTVTVSGAGSVWSNTVGLYVGNAGNGSLDITTGGRVIVSGTSYIGDDAGSMGDAIVEGTDSTWINTGDLYVGNAGTGTLTVSNAAEVVDNGSLYVGNSGSGNVNVTSSGQLSSTTGHIGYASGSIGEVNVDGIGSTWTNSGDLFVGYNGNGTLEITDGGNVTNFIGIIGRFTGSASSVIVDGSGSTWTNNGGAAIVGYAGAGTLDVTNGGQVTSRYYGFIGDPTGSSRVTVDGAGSSWTISDLGELDVGSNNGFGTLEVTGGGHVTNVVGFIGKYFGGGAATVDGVGSLWTNSSYLSVAEESDATLDISGGGQVTNTDAYIAWLSNKTGTVTVNGAGSTWTSTGNVSVGSGNAHGKLELSAGGQAASASAVIGYGDGSTGEVAVDGIGSMWTITNDLNVSLDFDGGDANLTVTNGGVVSAASVIVGEFGSLHGDGNIVGIVENGGLVSPGTSPGALTIDGDYLQTAIGELVIELASASSYDQLLVTDNATLGGTLTVNLIDGFTPTIGQMFTILTADDVDDTFDTQLLPSVPNLSFEVTYNAQSVVLSVVPALDGDYNADGTVDAADYVVWRKNDGTQAGYDTWRAHFGATAGSGAAAANGSAEASPSQTAVPEPSSMILMCGSVLLALFIKQRGKGRMCAVSELAGKSAGRPGD
ncbi:MAG: hypothetical protein WD738_20210 [Pirellulales bacterium]